MSENKIAFSCGRIAWKHKPQKGSAEIVECQKVSHYKTVEATPQQIFKLICEGRCWRAGIFKEGAVKTRDIDFKGARLIALDFDECKVSPQDMLIYCRDKGIEPNFWYYSFSQGKKSGDNYRIVWILDREITPNEYTELIVALLNDPVFNVADKACKNIGRLWFGTQNGGEFIKEAAISYNSFDMFPRKAAERTKSVRKKRDNESKDDADSEGEISYTDDYFIMPSYSFGWKQYLQGVCDLWSKWSKKQYLHYYQRLLLFSELKMLKYDKSVRHSILDEIMYYYDADLYSGSKCNREEIQYFLTSNKTFANNKLVRYEDKEYTIAEWFNSGDYLKLDNSNREERITSDELKIEADYKIPKMLNTDGIGYIECQTEAGKTERIINYIASQDLSKVKIIYSIPTYILIDEFKRRLFKKNVPSEYVFIPRKIEYTPEEQLYLDFAFPNYISVSEDMKLRKKELAMVEDKNKKGLFILTHAALTHLKNITADKIIIDENIEDCLVNRYNVNLSALGALKTFIYTKDEIKRYQPHYIEIEGNTTEEKENYIEKQIECVNADLQYIINAVQNEEPQTEIKNIDLDRLINYINATRLISDTSIKDSLKSIGQLKYATRLSVGINNYKKTRYLYFEVASNFIYMAYKKGISVSLLTGTPKLKQLEAGLPVELRGVIKHDEIKRADPIGNIYQWLISGASGSKSSMYKTLDYAIKELEKLNIDWTELNLLTLKSCRDMAKEKGFHIPTTEENEEIYIENCAGLDNLKGQDLIVIGKADIPKNAYVDMLHDADIDDIQRTITRNISNTGVKIPIFGFAERQLWELQAEQIRQNIEQAVGRARTLWYDCNVYVFCDFPVRNVKDISNYKEGVR